ncbi:MAG: glycoside hydrolase family 16 protein, partial [Mycobacterium sp.]
GLVAAAIAFPGCASASSAVFDDFNGPPGSAPNPASWSYVTGRGWDRGVETYRTANAVLDGQGNLAIRAVEAGRGFESGRVQTKNKLSLGYGKITARIKMPSGQGLWPAFWLVGADEATTPWPGCGEIDVIELVSGTTTYFTTIHGPRSGSSQPYQVQFSGAIPDLSTDYHEYWVEHVPDGITVGIDGTTLGTFTPQSLPAGARWVYNRPMYAILNLAVGGDWAGPPDASTRFPATMLVDWFRWEPM